MILGGKAQGFVWGYPRFWAKKLRILDVKAWSPEYKNSGFWVGKSGILYRKTKDFLWLGGFEKTDGAARKLIFRRFPRGRPKSGHLAIEKIDVAARKVIFRGVWSKSGHLAIEKQKKLKTKKAENRKIENKKIENKKKNRKQEN